MTDRRQGHIAVTYDRPQGGGGAEQPGLLGQAGKGVF